MNGLGTVYWKDERLDEAQQQFEKMLKILAQTLSLLIEPWGYCWP